jgi:CRISPR-associated protein Csh2
MNIRNSEILLIYEARLCNPNGDPDDENKPRIDPRTGTNLVSDVRLKRFFRNHISHTYGENYVWVNTVDGKHVDATQRLASMSGGAGGKDESEKKKLVFENCIDARLFGAVIPLKGESEGRGQSLSFTGPVQFSWGYSLHPVELVDSASITSVFKGRTTQGEAGTIGKDWRLYYSLIAFYGVVSRTRASNTGLNEDDVRILDNMLWVAISQDATTRSKIGHKPHLYLRTENDEDLFFGDLRKYVDVTYDSSKPIRSLSDLNISFNRLGDKLKSVTTVYIRESDEMQGKLSSLFSSKTVKALPHDLKITSSMLSRNEP